MTMYLNEYGFCSKCWRSAWKVLRLDSVIGNRGGNLSFKTSSVLVVAGGLDLDSETRKATTNSLRQVPKVIKEHLPLLIADCVKQTIHQSTLNCGSRDWIEKSLQEISATTVKSTYIPSQWQFLRNIAFASVEIPTALAKTSKKNISR